MMHIDGSLALSEPIIIVIKVAFLSDFNLLCFGWQSNLYLPASCSSSDPIKK